MFPILHQGNVSLFQKENYWRCDFVRILADHFLNLAKNTEGEENRDEMIKSAESSVTVARIFVSTILMVDQ